MIVNDNSSPPIFDESEALAAVARYKAYEARRLLKYLSEIAEYDSVIATFAPRNAEHYPPDAAEWIGARLAWQALRIIEAGPYAGERNFIASSNNGQGLPKFSSVALGDLADIVRGHSLINHLISKKRTAEHAAARYEKLRKLNPQQFAELWQHNIEGKGTFDELVDQLP